MAIYVILNQISTTLQNIHSDRTTNLPARKKTEESYG